MRRPRKRRTPDGQRTPRGLRRAIVLAITAYALPGQSSMPAARIGDMHVCPMVTGFVPHVGGPIQTGNATVLICNKPAATAGSMAACSGPPDMVMTGSKTVFIGGKPAARQGDPTVHGGTVTMACGTVLIGG